ncbi:MAG: hypothetical protein F6J90_24080 [Moorea sp. SIOASIH]|uniref:hypothetical protein n=1 Tax=Moorena sp. SIOASIH TaxID=2607817 RepID=UPI0013BA5CE2|nr:hypothetical protein [Moorena sp. SIOASIH]NEO39246.1 hypothetical protein [Moorena sp. SIOASIH]
MNLSKEFLNYKKLNPRSKKISKPLIDKARKTNVKIVSEDLDEGNGMFTLSLHAANDVAGIINTKQSGEWKALGARKYALIAKSLDNELPNKMDREYVKEYLTKRLDWQEKYKTVKKTKEIRKFMKNLNPKAKEAIQDMLIVQMAELTRAKVGGKGYNLVFEAINHTVKQSYKEVYSSHASKYAKFALKGGAMVFK